MGPHNSSSGRVASVLHCFRKAALEVAVVNVVQLYSGCQNPSALLTCSISILQATLRFQFVHVRSWCLEVAILHEVKRFFL